MSKGKELFFGGNTPDIIQKLKCVKCDKPLDFIVNTVYWVIDILLAVITTLSVLAFIYAGFLYIFSVAKSDLRKTANRVILYGAAGLIFASLSYALVTFISTFIPGLIK